MMKNDQNTIQAELINQDALTNEARVSLFELFEISYDCVQLDRFLNDLAKKSMVIVLKNHEGTLVGFSTIDLIVDDHLPEQLSYAIFSGDTVIHPDYRGEQNLALSWIRCAASIYHCISPAPLNWFLIVKGEKTYRYLPTFFNDYIPARGRDSGAQQQATLNYLGKKCFGEHFNIQTGVVEFKQSLGHLKQAEGALSARKLQNPERAFFVARNPKYMQGHELLCLAEISAQNFKPWGRKIFERALVDPIPMTFDSKNKKIRLTNAHHIFQ